MPKKPAKKVASRKPGQPLANPKHEAFARACVTMSATQAYLAAGYKVANNVAAAAGTRLLKSVKVSERVAELKAQLADKVIERATLSKADLMGKLAHNIDAAVALGQISASTAAIRLYGMEAHRMFVERRIDITKDLDKLNKTELIEMAGLTPEEADRLVAARRAGKS